MVAGGAEVLRFAEHCGQRCGGVVLLSGFVLGFGVVELSCGPLAQTSRFSLELLTLLVLQLVGPMLVSLLAMALLLPAWLGQGQSSGPRPWPVAVPATAMVGAVLLLFFLVAALTGGVLASPRADLIGEGRELLSGVVLADLLRSMLRCGVFLAILCGWSQCRGMKQIKRGSAAALVGSNLLVEGLMLLLGLKLLWITAFDPLRLSSSAQ
ncbi:hypothetical protein [Vulcanococcus sp.]|uniref:hypothetical protein n=1 Tax=Vulcanococcus sp. TaxID=2856995 RepID=UPI0037DA102B